MPETENDQPVYLITGASSGIGLRVARALAKMPVKIIMIGRRSNVTSYLAHQLAQESKNKEIHYLTVDLGSQDSIRHLAKAIKTHTPRLDAAIHLGGRLFPTEEQRRGWVDPHLEVNYLSRFLLTHLLLDLHKNTPGSKVITFSGMSYKQAKIDFTPAVKPSAYNWKLQQGASNLANLIFTYSLSEKVKPLGIKAICVVPGAFRSGAFLRTPGFSLLDKAAYLVKRPFLTSPETIAQEIVWLATHKDAQSFNGIAFHGKKPLETSPYTHNSSVQELLWTESLRLTGLETFALVPQLLGSLN